MKVLFIGEIVAGAGRRTVERVLPEIIREYSPDLILANAENISGGRGVTEEKIREMTNAGINYFTSGDHVFFERGTEEFIDHLPLVRPANYPGNPMGKGHVLIDTGAKGKVLLINLMGRTSFSSSAAYLDDPFTKADEILNLYKDEDIKEIIIDFHAEASSEKMAFGFYLDGRASIVVGSHWHVPSADAMQLPKGTLYVSDLGMTGCVDSVLGVKKEIIITLFKTAQNQRFEWEKSGRKAFRSVLFDTEAKTAFRIDKLI